MKRQKIKRTIYINEKLNKQIYEYIINFSKDSIKIPKYSDVIEKALNKFFQNINSELIEEQALRKIWREENEKLISQLNKKNINMNKALYSTQFILIELIKSFLNDDDIVIFNDIIDEANSRGYEQYKLTNQKINDSYKNN